MSKTFTSPFQAAGRRGYHHGNLRESLIDAARFLVAERGPQGFTLIEAARLVDVSPAAPYRHFKDRDALVAAVAAQGFDVFVERLRAAAGGALGQARLEALGGAYLAFAREEPGYYGAMFLASHGGARIEGGGFDLLAEAVRDALTTDGPASAEVEGAAMQVWALAHGVAVLATAGQWPRRAGTPSADEVLAQGVRAIVGGVRSGSARKVS